MEEKVLIASPTWNGHSYVIERYLKNLSKFTHKFDLVLVDTSVNEWKELKKLKNQFSDLFPIKLLRMKPTDNVFKTLSIARNMLIEHMLKNDYTHMLMLDTDTLPPADTIEKLISHDKNLVGFLCLSNSKKNYVVLKDGKFVKAGKRGLSWYSKDEIKKMKKLTKVWATSIGCLMVKRKVFEQGVKFKFNPYMNVGEDIWFFVDANSHGFDFWLDPYEVIHDSRYWEKAVKSMKSMVDKQSELITLKDLNRRMKRVELLLANLIIKLKKEGKICQQAT